MSHHWFGDSLALSAWSEIWLNEGFASWMGTKCTDHFNPQWQVWLRANAAKQRAMATDALSATHPIQQPVKTESEADSAFDAITYEKGGAILRMIEGWLSEAAFREGERRVIARLLDGPVQVMATGGGAVMDAATRALIRARCTSIWLRADLELLLARVTRRNNRPLLKQGEPRAILEKLMAGRYPVYAEADITIDSVDGPPEATVERVLAALDRHLGALAARQPAPLLKPSACSSSSGRAATPSSSATVSSPRRGSSSPAPSARRGSSSSPTIAWPGSIPAVSPARLESPGLATPFGRSGSERGVPSAIFRAGPSTSTASTDISLPPRSSWSVTF